MNAFEHPNSLRIFGPAGSGKTRELVQILQRHVDDGDFELGEGIIVSFTRAAAHDIAKRVAPDAPPGRYHCTIHALCKRYFGFERELAEGHIKEFFKDKLIDYRPGASPDPEDWVSGIGEQRSEGALLLAFWNLCRNRMITLEEGRRLYRPDDEILRWWVGDAMDRLYAEYREWKSARKFIDFTDMLEYAVGYPPAARWPYLVLDESQDCQPTGTMVWTPNGQVSIESLSVGDYVVAYDRKALYLSKAAITDIHVREHDGEVIRVRCGDRESVYTPEHICIVKMDEAFTGKSVLYLMRRGDSYRVGVTSSNHGRTSGGSSGLKGRLLEEEGEDAWILDVFDDRHDAYLWENLVTARFGIPQVRFTRGGAPRALPQEHIDRFWATLGSNREAAQRCLDHFRREIDHPFVSRGRANLLYGRATTVRACNLIDGMKMLNVQDREPGYRNRFKRTDKAWTPIRVNREHYSGLVHSLAVEKKHTYVADGIVTHNCTPLQWAVIDAFAHCSDVVYLAGDDDQAIYTWAGATPSEFLHARVTSSDVLRINHRSGGVIVDAAQSFIRRNRERQEKNIVATSEGGEIERVHDGEMPVIDLDESTFIMARAHYLNEPILAELTREAVPFVDQRGAQGVTGKASTAFHRFLRLHRGHAITLDEWRMLIESIPSNGPWLVRGSKKFLTSIPKREREDTLVKVAKLSDYGATEELQNAIRQNAIEVLARLDQGRVGYLREVERRYGEEYLDPAKAGQVCRVGSIHGFKGLEADHAIIHGGIPARAMREALRDPEPERRVFYVGMTRAKRKISHYTAGVVPAKWERTL